MSIQTNVIPGSVLGFTSHNYDNHHPTKLGIFSVSYRIALFPQPAGTTITVSLQSVNVLKD